MRGLIHILLNKLRTTAILNSGVHFTLRKIACGTQLQQFMLMRLDARCDRSAFMCIRRPQVLPIECFRRQFKCLKVNEEKVCVRVDQINGYGIHICISQKKVT